MQFCIRLHGVELRKHDNKDKQNEPAECGRESPYLPD